MLNRAIILFLATSCAAAAAPPQFSRPRTRSHKSRAKTPDPKSIEPPSAPANDILPSSEIPGRIDRLSSPKTKRLPPGRWKNEVAEVLEKILEHSGSDSPKYDPFDPPTAVLVLDDAAVNGDIADALFQRLVRTAAFKFDEEFWSLIPLQYGRIKIRASYLAFRGISPVVWQRDPYYRIYRKGMLRAYRSICAAYGRAECRRWQASLLKGFTESELRTVSQQTLNEELLRPLEKERVLENNEDPDPEWERGGLRLIPEINSLISLLRARGVDVWGLSSANSWSAEILGAEIGIDPSRIVGIRLKLDSKTILPEALIPTPTGSGASEALTLFIGREPVLIISSPIELELLERSKTGVALVIGEGVSRNREWMTQPPFKQSSTTK